MTGSNGWRVHIFLFLSFFSLIFTIHAKVEFTVIENPKPTFQEGKVAYLEKVGELKEPVHMDTYLALPSSFTMDPETENIYIYDRKHVKIFKYDKNLNLIKQAGDRGEGPGDIKVFRDSGSLYLQFQNNRLYAYNDYGRKVIIFDKDLRFINEVRHKRMQTGTMFTLDECENYYLRDLHNGIVGFDRDMNHKWDLLEDYRIFEFLFFDPPQMFMKNPQRFRFILLKFDVLNGSSLVVYSRYTGQFFIFESGRMIRKLNLYSNDVLKAFKGNLLRAFESEKRNRERRKKTYYGKTKISCSYTYADMYTTFFTDKGSGKHFWVQFSERKRKLLRLYKFDLEGKLEKTFYVKLKHEKEFLFFKLKGKDTFYATNFDSELFIFREIKNETN